MTMCGRYTQTKGPHDIRLQLDIDNFLCEITSRYNITSGQQCPSFPGFQRMILQALFL